MQSDESHHPNGDQSRSVILKVEKVHAQMVFTSINDNSNGYSTGAGADSYVLIDFMEAVQGMGLYCADLSDYIHVGDIAMADELVQDENVLFAKSVVFNFDVDERGDGNLLYYHTGRGTIQHVGEYFAGILADDPVDPEWHSMLLPITALTKNTIPVGKRLADVRLSELIHSGDKIIYKAPRENHKVWSARKHESV